ncbi:sigma-54-dependent transcriptional regulator [Salinispira pacifica]|uniref:Two component, sigma54 specific, transcriptional regulator, Fis family n=1 Tax=Salinispira pacifica TaxID=1307761 RepID=V5WFA6_9SPIO|nr:sigma-54 dependent transcriptional regulator [Salinispira pacifica]AHC14478.1 two component, sigma54 specific, transcriptional regulator, Fis family [Salinispira pacifica]
MTVLIIDDEKNIRESLSKLLEMDGFSAEAADHPVLAQEMLEAKTYACILLDLRMPDIDGLEMLDWIKQRGIQTPVMMMSAHGDIQDAVSALHKGAMDYLVKPFDIDELLIRMKRIIEAHQTSLRLRAGIIAAESSGTPTLQLRNPGMLELQRIINKAAPTESTVLITGESGTGKEITARKLHDLSTRKKGCFIPVNIAGISEQLLESELFGYEKGAFTGAEKQTPGIFEAAEGGTVFLDEIGEMSINLQAKLLRVLQERKIRRVGGVHEVAVDVRILAATNRDLETMVSREQFREDLFYRLNVLRISIPPLRERREEIPELIGNIIAKICRKLGRPHPDLSDEALAALKAYDYPGNIRELENLLERALILCEGNSIGLADFPGIASASRKHSSTKQYRNGHPPGDGEMNSIFDGSMKDIERRALSAVLAKHMGNRSRSAEQLGISRKTLISKIKEYGLD